MPHKAAHDQVDELRRRVADEGVKLRELQEQEARAKAELERVGDTIAAAYATEDPTAVDKARRAKEDVMARVEDLEHRVAGAQLRAERARGELDSFMAENALALLEEREPLARELAAELTAAVAEVKRAHAKYVAERMHVDQLVAKVPGAEPRYDSVATGYSWEPELKALERAFRENPEAEPPRPRWSGRIQRQSRNAVHRQLKEQRQSSGIVAAVRPAER
jgi:hypothetical protein